MEEFRREKDLAFRGGSQSPLTPEQQEAFTGLRYYPENPTLRFEVGLDTAIAHATLEMETSTGDVQTYVTAAKAAIEVEGQAVDIYLYSSGDPDELFLPFRDATSGSETYGAGRYLEVEVEEDGTAVIDFNYAYNPFCAYNDRWSCPLPPAENWLPVPIRAGEMTYPAEH